MVNVLPYGGKVWREECLQINSVQAFGRKRLNRSANGLLNVSTALDCFSLVNRR